MDYKIILSYSINSNDSFTFLYVRAAYVKSDDQNVETFYPIEPYDLYEFNKIRLAYEMHTYADSGTK